MRRSAPSSSFTTSPSWVANSLSAAPKRTTANRITAAKSPIRPILKRPAVRSGPFAFAVPPDPHSYFIIAGPTAVGKSELAAAVAERCGGEIVSADAFQVYQGLDILTAKPAPALRARVPHHLIGEIPLNQS